MQEAAAEWIRTEKWFPKPAELITIAADKASVDSRRQAIPAPNHVSHRPSEEYIRRVHAKCQEMGISNPTVNRWMAELESERAA